MVPESYHEFFVAAAGVAGALTGLVFVAISVLPERIRNMETDIEFQLGAAGTLLVFTDALSLSLLPLIPDGNLGYWALIQAIVGIAFTASASRLMLAEVREHQAPWSAFRRSLKSSLIFIFQAAAGIRLITNSGSIDGLDTIQYVILAALLVGILRTGRLVGLRDTGVTTSIMTLVRGKVPATKPQTTVSQPD